ncbi:MAG: GAF domain-containing protein [Rikenellaceae bacterium]|nr:GAF domain-containing protein [Rikenellaceae bacterium]
MTTATKKEKYESVIRKATALIGVEERPIPCVANICALLKEEFGFFWVGFYIADGDELVLGPFQGPVACMTIKGTRGVCGSCRQSKRTVIVDNVEEFPGHIACNPLSRSEIVVPILHKGQVSAVLDIDHTELSAFDSIDAMYLEKLLRMPFTANICKIYTREPSP